MNTHKANKEYKKNRQEVPFRQPSTNKHALYHSFGAEWAKEFAKKRKQIIEGLGLFFVKNGFVWLAGNVI